jgi:glycosyltransferase involved in cell wall biosynthesis
METRVSDDEPLVSVVIPCYKQAHYLPQAIDSVLAQTYPRHEIIVVDDGSPDDTVGVARRYPQLRYVRQDNKGLSAARNTGLAHCTGAFVVCLDADDRLTPEALASGLASLATHPECGFTAGHHRLIDAAGAPVVPQVSRPEIGGEHYRELLRRNPFWCPAAILYRRWVFEAVGAFSTTLRAAEDYDFYLRVARQFPICTHHHVVAEYRIHDAGMSRNPARMLKYSVLVLQQQRRLTKGNRDHEAACDEGIATYRDLYGTPLLEEIGAHLRARQWRAVVRESLIALTYNPRASVSRAARRLFRAVREAYS